MSLGSKGSLFIGAYRAEKSPLKEQAFLTGTSVSVPVLAYPSGYRSEGAASNPTRLDTNAAAPAPMRLANRSKKSSDWV
jgi:hypothetical protein